MIVLNPFNPEHIPNLFSKYKGLSSSELDKYSYLSNYLYFIQVTRDGGHFYFDGDNFFIFCRARELNMKWMIVFPSGNNVGKIVTDFCDNFYNRYSESILIKKVNAPFGFKLLSLSHNYSLINLNDFILSEDLKCKPDDIYPECVISLANLFDMADSYSIKNINLFKINKSSMRARIHSFIHRHKSIQFFFKIDEILGENIKNLFTLWVPDYCSRACENGQIISEDFNYFFSPYKDIIKFMNTIKDSEDYFSFSININGQLVASSIYGRISCDTFALYMLVSDNNKFRDSSEFCMLMGMQELWKKGVKYINTGGSESKGMYDFRCKFMPILSRKNLYLEFSK